MSEATLWNKLKAKGFSDEAVAAIMGNMSAESNCISYRLQGDFSSGFTKSLEYTEKVNTGQITRDQFAYHGPGGGGYGLCQWTYPTRKLGLYDLAVRKGASIGDEQIGVDWFWEELHQAEYAKTRNALNADNSSIKDKVAVMLRNYEKPADQSDAAVAYRYNEAMRFYNKYHGSTPDPVPVKPDPPVDYGSTDSCELVVRVLRNGDRGNDVRILQLYLVYVEDFNLGDYGPNMDGVDGWFGEKTEIALNEFKSDCNLPADGVADEAVWQIMFQ